MRPAFGPSGGTPRPRGVRVVPALGASLPARPRTERAPEARSPVAPPACGAARLPLAPSPPSRHHVSVQERNRLDGIVLHGAGRGKDFRYLPRTPRKRFASTAEQGSGRGGGEGRGRSGLRAYE